MNEELKPNMCKLKFACCDSPAEPCVYRSGHGIKECRHRNDKTYGCNSVIARVNAMVIELKKHGIDHQNLDFIKKIGDLLQVSLDSGTGLKSVEDAMNMINEYLYSK